MDIDISNFNDTNIEERECDKKANVGDIIVTKYYTDEHSYVSPTEENPYNYYLVVAINNPYGGMPDLGLINLHYSELISTEFTRYDVDIIDDYY